MARLPPSGTRVHEGSVVGRAGDLARERVVVVGLGKSGVAAARFCASKGASVVATDHLTPAKLASAVAELGPLGIRFELGDIRAETLRAASLVVLSPGVPPTIPAVRAAREAGVRIVGEIELAAWFIDAPIVGVTGTNGKSTVTSLCGAIAQATGRPSFCGGNLGLPAIGVVGTPAAGREGIVVCELSSFQLETVDRLRCTAATLLNMTPDHLDRYASMTAYGDAKAAIFRGMDDASTRVLNGDDPVVADVFARSFGRDARVAWFSTRRHTPVPAGWPTTGAPIGFVDGGDLVLRGVEDTASAEERYPIDELQIVGRHNLANALAAFLLMRGSRLATYAQVREAARRFRPLAHRMELVAERDGVRYYDDSKGTNVDAVVAGLDGFPRPFALIAGGRHKGGSYEPLARVLARNHVRGVVVIGEAATLIADALPPGIPVAHGRDMQDAVDRARAMCEPGDAVILSPACSSFDMFRDYAHRAEVFRGAIGERE